MGDVHACRMMGFMVSSICVAAFPGSSAQRESDHRDGAGPCWALALGRGGCVSLPVDLGGGKTHSRAWCRLTTSAFVGRSTTFRVSSGSAASS